MTTPAALAHGSFTVDPWDPSYGPAAGDELDAALGSSSAQLDLDVEVPASQWRPIDPDMAISLPGTLLFLDGVRRIDARIWVHGGGPQPALGIAASFAAGLVCCNGLARIAHVDVQRGLFTAAPPQAGIATRYATYPARPAGASGLDQLSLALQGALAEAEVQLALLFRAQHPDGDDLLVVDGPLRGRSHLERTVGYVKTHHASYLPATQATVVASLAPGQRTPVFTMGTSWRRSSWYLRLPGSGAGGQGAPWSGVVRLECAADLAPAHASRLADLTARLLPPLSSAPHKDPRAPQNLVPIGGLERELRHRLGDQHLLYRALRAAAA
jgi:hypothetical protein